MIGLSYSSIKTTTLLFVFLYNFSINSAKLNEYNSLFVRFIPLSFANLVKNVLNDFSRFSEVLKLRLVKSRCIIIKIKNINKIN